MRGRYRDVTVELARYLLAKRVQLVVIEATGPFFIYDTESIAQQTRRAGWRSQ